MAVATIAKQWTLEEVHSLPDDGNKYELIRGELFVTPPPNVPHEDIGAILNAILAPYVDDEQRVITVARLGVPDRVERSALSWHPAGASEPLTFDVQAVFD